MPLRALRAVDLEKLLDPAGPSLADTDECAAQYDRAPETLRGMLGLYLFAASAQLPVRPASVREPGEYLRDPLVLDALFRTYDLVPAGPDALPNLLPLDFLKTGTTSLILRANSRYVLKLIKPRFWNVESIAAATAQYKTTYGGLGSFCPRVHASKRRWILMDFLEGSTLTDYSSTYCHQPNTADSLSEAQLTQIQEIVRQLCHALKMCADRKPALHHLDLSPDNVIIDHVEGRVRTVKLIDFGVNYLLTVGTFGDLSRAQVFIASELQQEHSEGNELSDIYSLGLLLLEMLSPKLLTAEELSACLDSAWNRCPELAELIEDMVDRRPENRLLRLDRSTLIFQTLPSTVAEALQIHIYAASRRPSSIEILIKSMTGAPIDILIELFRRTVPKNSAQPRLRWLLYWGVLVQALGVVALYTFILLTFFTYDFRWCDRLGICIANQNSPRLPFWDGALFGRVNGLLPGRLVALSFALILIKYYAEIFGPLTTWHLRFKKTRSLAWWSEIMVRSFPVLGVIPIFYALGVDPKAWPFCSALGLVLICATNLVVYSLARSIRANTENAFDLPHSPFIADQIATFSRWWKTIFLYLCSMAILGFVLRSGLAQDEWLYAVFVSVFANMLIMYRHHCSEAAPAIRSALQRLILAAKRLELKELRASASQGGR